MCGAGGVSFRDNSFNAVCEQWTRQPDAACIFAASNDFFKLYPCLPTSLSLAGKVRDLQDDSKGCLEVYTTPCGCAVIAVDLALLAFYVFNVRTTLSQESGRADSYFYRRWGVAFGCWFGALPFSAALSKILLAPYVWYIVSLSITKGSNALVYGALVVALWPENRRTHFKLISASPEELLENCPSPGGSAREHEVSEFLPGAKLWLNARDLPNLLCQKLVQDDTFHLSKSQSRVS